MFTLGAIDKVAILQWGSRGREIRFGPDHTANYSVDSEHSD